MGAEEARSVGCAGLAADDGAERGIGMDGQIGHA